MLTKLMTRSIYFRDSAVADPCPGTPGSTLSTTGMIISLYVSLIY